jgi:ABC-type polysaccharide/polyol phosphate transport system ATPase subunit
MAGRATADASTTLPEHTQLEGPGPDVPAAVTIDGVGKSFRIPQEAVHTLKERALHPFRRRKYNEFEALHDVSFEVRRGEFFGIVGRNGSGKSTLLKCLAGIYRADRGRMYVDGRMSTFIELGVGFNPDLAAFDNVVTNGVMLGLSPSEARKRFDDIIAFAELEEFTDLKLKNYSSGMLVRLAFAVMTQVDADVLLVDEVLAVGDAAFQQKCFDVFNRLRDQGKTILFVTHDMGAVVRFCHRAVLLERGKVVTIDIPDKVATRYMELNLSGVESTPGWEPEPRGGDGSARVVEWWTEDEHGTRETAFAQGTRCTFRARIKFQRDVQDPSFTVAFINEHRQHVVVFSTVTRQERTGHFKAGETVEFRVSFVVPFGPGRYHMSTELSRRGTGYALMDRYERFGSIVVAAPRSAGGLIDVPHEMELRRL